MKSRRLINEMMHRRRREIGGVLGLMSPQEQQRLALALVLADFNPAAANWSTSVDARMGLEPRGTPSK